MEASGRSFRDGGANGGGAVGLVLVFLTAKQRPDRGAHTLRVEWLYYETFGPASAREEDIRTSIQQHQDRDRL